MTDLRLRINELPEELNPAPIDNIAIDGPSTRRTTLQRAADAARPYSTEAMAREGLDNATAMTPLRVSQAIETLGSQRFATSQQGDNADSAVQPSLTISAGAGLTGGGTLAANREIALNSASIASLALANSAVQPARQVIAGVGLTGGGNLSADRTLSLSAATQASIANADTAIQPGDSRLIPAGGLSGQVLVKVSRTDFDAEWKTSEAATAVSYGPQTLTAEQQGQARENIDAQQAGTNLEAIRSAGAASSNKFPYFDSDSSAKFTDLTAQARTMLASTTPAIASLGYTPVNKSGDSGLKAMSWDEAPNNWQHRFTATVTLAAGANFVFSPGSGLIIAAENAGGSVAAFLVGGGGYKLLGQSIGAYWADTPSATLFMQYAGGTYYIGNGSGVTKTLFIAALQVRSVS
ncbi:hypothetical protein IB024_01900 [Brucella sp. 6810]|uniref:hypothetical protein n=1 Tax=Brucella sp. 6810 TaxID=2769351 RepID=UPI00165C0B5A|nr:hypothetical protein [Brucella sp. 6810]QNQ62536.1 hypothetical protein IB024_01900 [Brucella sp. 6810]